MGDTRYLNVIHMEMSVQRRNLKWTGHTDAMGMARFEKRRDKVSLKISSSRKKKRECCLHRSRRSRRRRYCLGRNRLTPDPDPF